MRTIGILGATGSIGTQAMNLVEQYPDDYRASVLTAHSNAQGLFDLARKVKPDCAGLVVKPEEIPGDLKSIQWFFGADASQRALCAAKPDDALAAVVGIAGLPTVLCALDVCKRVLLANKEALVTGGALVMEKARRKGVELLPVDSEHSAIFQCLQGAAGNPVNKIILTASGGALRTWDAEKIERATPGAVLKHPTWAMGSKITVDCASMMNKGLEVIEAHYLFDTPVDQIEVIVHPESIIHSMVEFSDGAVIAQMGMPDMRMAIGYAMGYPNRMAFGGERIDFAKLGALHFLPPDLTRFACLRYAIEAIQSGGIMPVALNGANEVAVEAFLRGRIPFGQIARVVNAVLNETVNAKVQDVETVYEADRDSRARAAEWILRSR